MKEDVGPTPFGQCLVSRLTGHWDLGRFHLMSGFRVNRDLTPDLKRYSLIEQVL